ncbi:MAG: sugar transferase [Candidatus Delongbacteria bacterium]|jgi:lipopolysaccharide/colanic/teichoic acid biosynthesis glycosyltransferase|nr:sugar transferase [Candidatus Delongbacteria bacterium]
MPAEKKQTYLLFKRIFDIIFAIILLIATLPILLIIAILIKLEDPKGSVFFRQKRIGYKNKEFLLFKFRSMIIDQVKNGIELTDTERMLKIGTIIRKFSFDELPQIINILKGEMSLIGPRALPTVYLPYYTEKELHRHDVKPGISGWAQVNGRNFLTWDEKFKLDLYYVNNICFSLDFNIFFMTIFKIFIKKEVGVRGADVPDVSLYQIREKRIEKVVI